MSDAERGTEETMELCANCGAREATVNWAGTLDSINIARNPSWLKRWCELCQILNALAELELLRVAQPAREMVAFLAGYTNVKSPGFVKAIGQLSVDSLVRYPSPGTIVMTDAGRAQAQYPEAARSSQEIQERVISMLGGKAAEVLRPLIKAYPSGVTRADVAAEAGYTNVKSAGFVKVIGQLRTLGFADYPDPGSIAAAPVLFLEA